MWCVRAAGCLAAAALLDGGAQTAAQKAARSAADEFISAGGVPALCELLWACGCDSPDINVPPQAAAQRRPRVCHGFDTVRAVACRTMAACKRVRLGATTSCARASQAQPARVPCTQALGQLAPHLHFPHMQRTVQRC
jgi:hypothetical protein